MIDKNGNITKKSIERVQKEGYGDNFSIFDINPARVVSTSIGRGSFKKGVLDDTYDYNNDAQGKRVRQHYINNILNGNAKLDYRTARFFGQTLGSDSDMPDEYKIRTVIRRSDLNRKK